MKKTAIFAMVIGIAAGAGAFALLNPQGFREMLGASSPPFRQQPIPAKHTPAPAPASSLAQASAPLATLPAFASSPPLATSATTAIDPSLALLGAVQRGDPGEVQAMLDKGANPNVKDTHQAQYDGDEDGSDRTPLHYLVMGRGTTPNTEAIIKLLIARGANVNAADSDGATPLHYALGTSAEGTEARNAVEKMVAALVSSGANVDAPRPMTGDTPLHMAAYNGYKALVELLLAKGANANATNKAGQTPLFYAMDKDIAELLLDHGAKVNIKSKSGDTPLSFSLSHNYSDLARLLRAHGAKE